VQITFDPQVVSYQTLLEIFFTIHDPTSSTVKATTAARNTLHHSVSRRQPASDRASRHAGNRQQRHLDAPLVTQLQALERFYPAEDYHQSYYRGHPNQGYCMLVVAPKVVKFREKYRSC